ncbi:MAG TPA: anthranilate synthase component I family protein [Pyrinomonadaceae bacterium]|nr:anthranilate synthase component I family protein [Pyrinomonadaceae bacterium]
MVAVTSTLFSRRLDPLDAYVRIAGSARQSFLFESVEGGEAVAKYSFLGADPYMVVRGEGNQTIIEKQGSIETRDETVPDFLRRHFTLHRLAPRDDLGPLAGGAVGYLGYGAARWFEPALNKSSRPPVIPDSTVDVACFMFCRNVVIFDRLHESITMVAVVLTDEAEGNNSNLKRLYDSAVHHIATTAALLASLNIDHTVKVSSRTPERGNDSFTPSVRSNWAPADFADGVRQIKEHILAGNCYQAVLSQRFTRETTAGAVSIYRALRRSNPAPYTFLLKLGAEAIIGASPEMLVRCRGDQLDYRPIAGTRRRGATDEEDQGLAEEMRADEKEVAEHMMLVDLGRNDLGRVAAYGSVRVEELMSVERYSKVQHLVSSLSARLAAGRDRFAALAACFPAGTVTGAPKVRAMEIINELEPDDRGVYAGAVLYADYAGNLDSCITIRTIIMKDGVASVQAGAGIVADSVPELEFEETVHKAAALLRAIEIAEEE